MNTLEPLMKAMVSMIDECKVHKRIYSTDVERLINLMAEFLKDMNEKLAHDEAKKES